MATSYLEIRQQSARGTDSIAADVMRHLHARQHLGKTVVVCSQPLDLIGPMRKQWLKLSRALQKQRSGTVNADKILKYTHNITHMQHMHFTVKSPLDQPDADIYFLKPGDINILPVHCWTIYLLSPVKLQRAEGMLLQLPSNSLIVTYQGEGIWPKGLDLPPKTDLEDQVYRQWRQVKQFMAGHKIDVELLVKDELHNIEAMDDALDTLLSVSHKFLQVANEFQRALELARPLRIGKKLRTSYDSVVLLAHRVQALTPGAFSQHFLETYHEDDTFFLYDATRLKWPYTESLAEAFARHMAAGRHHLARSLQLVAET